MTTPRHVIYLSGSRADFGLMRSTLQLAASNPALRVQVAVTGLHLSSAHGHTVDDVRAAGLTVCGEVPVDVTTRTRASMAAGIGECLQGMTPLLQAQRPDFLVLLGDRGEMLAGAMAALHLGIASVHIHGGERSGTVDEPVRHAISKLSTWHPVVQQSGHVYRQAMVCPCCGSSQMPMRDRWRYSRRWMRWRFLPDRAVFST